MTAYVVYDVFTDTRFGGNQLAVFPDATDLPETDLQAMALGIKAIESAGIKNFGEEHQLIPVAFGIKKLRLMVLAYEDDGAGNSFGEDELFDLFNELYEDDIQSIDTHSFTKM